MNDPFANIAPRWRRTVFAERPVSAAISFRGARGCRMRTARMRRSIEETAASTAVASENGGETAKEGSPRTFTSSGGGAASGVVAYVWAWKDRSTSNPAHTTGSTRRTASIAGSDSSSDPIERTVLGGGPVRDRGRSAGSGGRMAQGRAGGRRRGPGPPPRRGLPRYRAARVRPQQGGLARAARFGRLQVSEHGAARPGPPKIYGLGDPPRDRGEQVDVQGTAGLRRRAPRDLHFRPLARKLAPFGSSVQSDSGGSVMATSTAQRGPSAAEMPSAGSIRTFLLVESATFLSAAAFHSGVFLPGFAHGAAAAAESVIASILLGGLLATWILPRAVRGIALAVQGFALIGTFVGLFTIAIGIGPRTVPDLVIHAIMVIELVWGVVVAGRARAGPAGASS